MICSMVSEEHLSYNTNHSTPTAQLTAQLCKCTCSRQLYSDLIESSYCALRTSQLSTRPRRICVCLLLSGPSRVSLDMKATCWGLKRTSTASGCCRDFLHWVLLHFNVCNWLDTKSIDRALQMSRVRDKPLVLGEWVVLRRANKSDWASRYIHDDGLFAGEASRPITLWQATSSRQMSELNLAGD